MNEETEKAKYILPVKRHLNLGDFHNAETTKKKKIEHE